MARYKFICGSCKFECISGMGREVGLHSSRVVRFANLAQQLMLIRWLIQEVLILKLVLHLLVQVASLPNIWKSGMGLLAHIVR